VRVRVRGAEEEEVFAVRGTAAAIRGYFRIPPPFAPLKAANAREKNTNHIVITISIITAINGA
jgi:hypothetical protein